MKISIKFFVFCNFLYTVACIYIMENETEHAYATDSTYLDNEYYALINATNRNPVMFLQKMDALLVNQITQPVKHYSVTISYSVNEYNKVLDYIISKLQSKSVLHQQEIMPVANIVCKMLRPKFLSSIINYESMRNIFEWDDIDIEVFYSLIQTTKELWSEMTQAYDVIRGKRYKKMRHTNRTEQNFISKPKNLHKETD